MPVAVFFGATAVGKTAIASQLFSSKTEKTEEGFCSRLAGRAEIVSADSVQVYRYLKTGSAAPSQELLARLPHHLIAVRDPSEEFSAADFVTEADKLCPEIYSRGKLPVLLGGTAFFIKNFIYGLPTTPKADPAIRKHFQDRVEREGAAVLLEELKKIDPVTAEKLHLNDEYRIVRACEVFAASGKPLSSFALSETVRSGYAFFIACIKKERRTLYAAIEKRVDAMMADGLPEEAAGLLERGFTAEAPALKAIGYREFFNEDGSFKGFSRLDEIAELIKRNTKHYAKRQETFFKKIPGVRYYDAEKKDDMVRLYGDVCDFYEKYRA